MLSGTIIVDQVAKNFGPVRAVANLSFGIQPGSIFGLVGSNGAGKSTTLKILCGLEKPSSGTARIDGLDCWKQRSQVKLKLGYVPQSFDLYPDLTVREHLEFFAAAFRLEKSRREQQITRLLARTDLTDKASALAGKLSGGQKRLLSLACALVHDPKILFLDEPTAGLDPAHRETLWDWLYELAKAGTTIGVTTHYLEEAERCLEIAVMNAGRLMAQGSPTQLKVGTGIRPFEIHADPLIPALNEIKRLPEIFRASLSNGAIRVLAHQPDALYRRLESAWPYSEITSHRLNWCEPTLDDACSALTLPSAVTASIAKDPK
jgi:ABC-type multidrug transport system ATPase subunit